MVFNISEINKAAGFVFEKMGANKILYRHKREGLDIKMLLLYKNNILKVMFCYGFQV
jgi:hypothetical protein